MYLIFRCFMMENGCNADRIESPVLRSTVASQVLQTEKGMQYFHDNLKKESLGAEAKLNLFCKAGVEFQLNRVFLGAW